MLYSFTTHFCLFDTVIFLMPQSIVLKDLTVTKRTLNLEKALLYFFLFLQTTFFYYFLFMFVIVCYGACLAFFIVFSCFLWVVLFPLVLCPTCNLSIYTFCCFYMTSFFKKVLLYYYTDKFQSIQSYNSQYRTH